MHKDLGDIVYEMKVPKDHFVNVYYKDTMTTNFMTSVLVVIHKKNIPKFQSTYYKVLTEHYKTD